MESHADGLCFHYGPMDCDTVGGGNVIQEHTISFYHGVIRFLWNACAGVRVYSMSYRLI